MAKPRRIKPPEPKKQVTGPSRTESLEVFMADWGRLVVPLGVAGVLAALRLSGIIDETGLGFAIGSVFLLGVLAAFGSIAFRALFPPWVRIGTIGMFVAVIAGAGVPFYQTIYPGKADFTAELSKAGETADLGRDMDGRYRLEVFASSMASQPSSRARVGKYRIVVAGNRINGQFSDRKRSVRAGRRGSKQVEEKHLTDTYPVTVDPGAGKVELLWLDKAIGPAIRVSLYEPLLHPILIYLLLGLSMLFALFLDARFQDQTYRWRLTPWIGMVIAFMLIFERSYEKGGVSNTAIWSVIFGSAIGFTLGWAVSLAARKAAKSMRS